MMRSRLYAALATVCIVPSGSLSMAATLVKGSVVRSASNECTSGGLGLSFYAPEGGAVLIRVDTTASFTLTLGSSGTWYPSNPLATACDSSAGQTDEDSWFSRLERAGSRIVDVGSHPLPMQLIDDDNTVYAVVGMPPGALVDLTFDATTCPAGGSLCLYVEVMEASCGP